MIRSIYTAVALVAALALPAAAHGYGAYHAGCTTVTPGGVQHYGTTAVATPYGTATHSSATAATPYGAAHTSTTTASGAYGSAAATTTRAYSPTTYAGYSAAGVSTAGGQAGVVRTGYAYR